MSIERFKPFHDNVFVEIDPDERTTSSGLFIPQSEFGDKLLSGRVIAAGPGCVGHNWNMKDERVGKAQFFEVPVSVGDRVLFKRSDGEPVSSDNTVFIAPSEGRAHEYMVLRGTELVAVVEEACWGS